MIDHSALHEGPEVAYGARRPLDSQTVAEMADAANRAKDVFMAMLSHELRSPLGAILAWARLLQTAKLPPAEVARGSDAIERNARLLSRLVEDLLDASRISTGKLTLHVQSVDLAAVTMAALDDVRTVADAKGIQLVSLIGPPACVAGDPDRLQQVVSNLLSNAVKFSFDGGRVLVRVATDDSHALVAVRDAGEGIASDFLPHVFQRFRQASEESMRTHGGLGLGLAIVRDIVEMHHGTVKAESGGRGRGATFAVALPLFGFPQALRIQPEDHGGAAIQAPTALAAIV
jgi:signal transduction histidine kinase